MVPQREMSIVLRKYYQCNSLINSDNSLETDTITRLLQFEKAKALVLLITQGLF